MNRIKSKQTCTSRNGMLGIGLAELPYRTIIWVLTMMALMALVVSFGNYPQAAHAATTRTTVDDGYGSGGVVGRNTSIALTSSGNPVISYYDDTNRDLKVAVCNDATCSSPTITTVDSERGRGVQLHRPKR
jgi:hypothetical protein